MSAGAILFGLLAAVVLYGGLAACLAAAWKAKRRRRGHRN